MTTASSRARILKAAERLFAEQGFRGVTVRDIARAARVNLAAINYHFGDKLGLYQEIVRSAIATMRATTEEARRAGEGLAAEERLGRYVAAIVGRLLRASGPTPLQNLILREINDPTPALDDLVRQGVRPRIEYLSALVAQIIGCPASDTRVRRCVFSIHSQTIGAMSNPIARRLGFEPRPADAQAIARHITRFSLAGIRGLGDRRAARRPPVQPRPRSRKAARSPARA